ncbi:hypothetical protein DFQ28_004750 [Apophysomyces sp. BC1034]|nr:hypothetical protein DFQ30_010607 [Apophysomyces sp. BC1015]KAG0180944.1 hypothetical protein DFQ29_009765 [Apophysomyces sp. BC1021]KAG0188515.1 hypothetical protein DFQ28_004750 [Apophysomyces sp. BC1034]
MSIGVLTWWTGTARDSLAVVGFSYLVIFDALGIFSEFVSDVIRLTPSFTASNTKRPFGAQRYEIVLALGTTIYLLFATMYTTKESMEHLLLEESHENSAHHDKRHSGFGLFLVMLVGIAASFASSFGLKNHGNLVKILPRAPLTISGVSQHSALSVLLSNVYSLGIVGSGVVVLLFHLLGLASPAVDKLLAFGESAVMLYLGGPTAAALAKLLLQTTPDTASSNISSRLYELRQDPTIISVDRAHFWQNSYGQNVGTVEIRVRPEADEQAVLEFVYAKLENLTTSRSADGSSGELTVSILKQ